jgi:hypothetical protein
MPVAELQDELQFEQELLTSFWALFRAAMACRWE